MATTTITTTTTTTTTTIWLHLFYKVKSSLNSKRSHSKLITGKLKINEQYNHFRRVVDYNYGMI